MGIKFRDLIPFVTRAPKPAEQKSVVYTQDHGWMDTRWDLGFWQQDRSLPQMTVNETVEACVSALAQTLAMCPVHHYVTDANGTKRRQTGSNVERVIRYPNSYQSRTEFFNTLIRAMYFTGNGLAVGTRDNRGAIGRLDIVDSRSTRGVFDPETGDVYYWVSPLTQGPPLRFDSSTDMVWPGREVLHLRLHSARNPLDGVTPIYSAAANISASNALTGHQASFFNNMARPSGALFTDEKLKPKDMDQLRAAVNAQAKATESGGLPIFGWGMEFKSMSLNSQDAQLVEAYGMTVEGISRAFRVPLALINDLRNSTLNNAEAMMNWFLASGLGFLLEHVELELGRLFDLPFNACVNFETEVLLRADWKSRVETITEGMRGGLYSPDEGRAKEGLPPAPDGHGEEPRVQRQVVPLSAYQDMAEEPEPEPEMTPDEVEAALSDVVEKAIGHG